MRRKSIDAIPELRCDGIMRPADGSEVQFGRHKKIDSLCKQHHNMREKMEFPCCGGSDEHPPEHTMDCETRQSANI